MTTIEHALVGYLLYHSAVALPAARKAGVTSEWFEDPALAGAHEAIMAEACAAAGYVDLIMARERIVHAGKAPMDAQLLLESCVDAAPVTRFGFERLLAWMHKRVLERTTGQQIDAMARELATADPASAKILLANIEDAAKRGQVEILERPTLGGLAQNLVAKYRQPVHLDETTGIYWPVSALNQLVGPLRDEFVWLAARESCGKTAFAVQLAVHAARRGNLVAFKSLESPAEKIAQRMISHIGRVNTLHLRQHWATTPDMMASADKAAAEIGALSLLVDDADATMQQVVGWAEDAARQGAKLLIVDNLRHIRPDHKYASPVEQFRDFSVRLKWARDRVRLPLVVLHHLTDDGNVAWSRDIRRDADILLTLSIDGERAEKPCAENQWRGRAVVVITVEKNRDGIAGVSCESIFRGDIQTFEGTTA
ncbi:MAG: DnaB-like helicase C-terminal domain-containing protein [Candidatus Edwardsbacteria bacterium]|nr:DnaB-like helicase C-terminal domain-containing protein [Candidatus Edwardsbacteria bacterium]